MRYNKYYFDSLRDAIEQSAMRKIEHASDFDFLHEEIRRRTGETIGTTTLKRLWGYIDSYRTTREPTLDVLSRFVGYPDWQTFVAECCGEEDRLTSHRVITSTINAADVAKGESVWIEWNPGRRVHLVGEGNGWFTVAEAENSKVKAGDRFHCDRFTIGQPLYVDSLCHEGQLVGLFVMGKRGGLTRAARGEN